MINKCQRFHDDLHQLCVNKTEIRLLRLYVYWRKFYRAFPHMATIGITHAVISILFLVAYPSIQETSKGAIVILWTLSYFITTALAPVNSRRTRRRAHAVGVGRS